MARRAVPPRAAAFQASRQSLRYPAWRGACHAAGHGHGLCRQLHGRSGCQAARHDPLAQRQLSRCRLRRKSLHDGPDDGRGPLDRLRLGRDHRRERQDNRNSNRSLPLSRAGQERKRHMTDQMKAITLASRPEGEPKDENFKLETRDVPTPSEGEVLVRVHYMSLDPYMRGRMDDAKSYAAPVPIGGVMEGGGVGEVLASEAEGFAPGDMVFGMFGWATHGVAKAKDIRKLDPRLPATTALGVLGMPGFTGWYGLTEL